jgi:hypothetical protein
MDAFHEALARRTRQFEDYLRKMEVRRHGMEHDCFIVFHERAKRQPGETPTLAATRKAQRELARTVSGGLELSANLFDDGDAADTGFSNEPSGPRDQSKFIQFAFWERFFVADLPNDILLESDGRRIQRDRAGFFFVGERTDYPYYQRDVAVHNPLQKQYVYGDQEAAAADAAHVFFRVWNFPIDSRLYVSDSAFAKGHRWEESVLLD